MTHYTFIFFFFNDTATTEIYTLSLHDALPISTDDLAHLEATRPSSGKSLRNTLVEKARRDLLALERSEEHTSELQSRLHLVCRLLLEKKKDKNNTQQLDSTNVSHIRQSQSTCR